MYLSRTVSELSHLQICSNFEHFAFLSHPLGGGGLEKTYDVYLGLIGKRVVDFLLVLIEIFHQVLRLSSYERKEIENRRFRSNAVSLIQNFR